ncbi:MAG: ABC transporter substrate-binding protein [Actinobacteria bacterium]|nr:ABC transporter substrate-binding protein [Actinomycetota bacterium]
MQRRAGRSAVLAVFTLMGLAALSFGCAKDPTTAESSSPGSTAFQAATDREASAGPPQPGGQLSFGLAAETSGWNPYIGQWAGSAYFVANTIFDPLAAIDPQGAAKPYLAEAFTPNADFTQWTIKLRPGINFHNGTKLDAEAVRQNLQTGRDSGLTKLVFETVVSLDPVDNLTLVVKMSKPWSTFPLTLAAQPGYMAAPEQLADSANGQANPIGTGPFVFNSWVRDSSLKVRKNPTYWQEGKLPYLDAVEFKVLTDIQGRTAALESGAVDAIEVATPEPLLKYQELARNGDYQMFTDAGLDTDETIIALNTTQPPFNDPIAREAIATGLDQRDLSDTSYSGAFPPAWGPFAEGSRNYLSPEEAGYPKYDPARARQLVEEYKAKNPGQELRFTALIPPEPTYQRIAQALQQRAKEFGVQVDLQAVEQTKLITDVLGGNYQASGFVLFSTPGLDRGYVFIATDPTPGLSLNFTRYLNPNIKKAMDDARATDDPAKQAEAYKTVQKEMAKDLDKIFLVHNVGAVVYRNNVHGVRNTKFPGTDIPAYAGFATTPFFTATWKSQDTPDQRN